MGASRGVEFRFQRGLELRVQSRCSVCGTCVTHCTPEHESTDMCGNCMRM